MLALSEPPVFKVELQAIHDEIQGTVTLPADDPGFALEGLSVIVEKVAAKYGVPADQVIRDLYSIITGRVK